MRVLNSPRPCISTTHNIDKTTAGAAIFRTKHRRTHLRGGVGDRGPYSISHSKLEFAPTAAEFRRQSVKRAKLEIEFARIVLRRRRVSGYATVWPDYKALDARVATAGPGVEISVLYIKLYDSI